MRSILFKFRVFLNKIRPFIKAFTYAVIVISAFSL